MATMNRTSWTNSTFPRATLVIPRCARVSADILQPEDDDFKLDGYDDLGIIEEGDDEDEDAKPYDPEYDDNMIGQKRKRVKPAFAAQTTRAIQRSAMRAKDGNSDAFILDEDTGLATKPTSRVPGKSGPCSVVVSEVLSTLPTEIRARGFRSL